MLAEYEAYADAQAAVDRLSDEGFPVAQVSIIWHRLRRVEYVTGRRTTARAFLEGVGAGVWFGAILGLFLSLFVELDDGVTAVGMILTYALVGAVVVGIWRAVGHWMRRGARDFSSVDRLEAERYQLWVDNDLAHRAMELLDLRASRPMDPEPGP